MHTHTQALECMPALGIHAHACLCVRVRGCMQVHVCASVHTHSHRLACLRADPRTQLPDEAGLRSPEAGTGSSTPPPWVTAVSTACFRCCAARCWLSCTCCCTCCCCAADSRGGAAGGGGAGPSACAPRLAAPLGPALPASSTQPGAAIRTSRPDSVCGSISRAGPRAPSWKLDR